jgi:16S rRNA (guanine966-N2)-methyltransferase
MAYDVAFADPPYSADAAAQLAERWAAVPFARVLGVEHAARAPMPPGGDTRRYGTTAITFYRAADAAESSDAAESTDAASAGGAAARLGPA